MPVAEAPSEADIRSVLRAALEKLSAPIGPKTLVAKHLQGPYRQLAIAEVERVLKDEVAAGRAFRYPPATSKSKESRYWTVDLERLAETRVREALSDEPLTLAALKKKCGPELKNGALPPAHWTSLLTRLCQAGQAFQSGAAKAARYSSSDPTAAASEVLLGALAAAPATLAALKKATPKLNDAIRKQTLAALAASGRLYVLPPAGRSKSERYSLTALDAREFLTGPIEKLLEALAAQVGPAGVSRAEVAAVASQLCLAWEPSADSHSLAAQLSVLEPSDAATPTAEKLLDEALLQVIYDRITMVEPAAPIGALVSVRELRRALDFQNLSKEEFDHALLTLADRQRVLLHAHDYPGSLNARDRAAMVEDEQGRVYIGVMLNN